MGNLTTSFPGSSSTRPPWQEREDPGNEILKCMSKSIVIRTLPLLRLYGILND